MTFLMRYFTSHRFWACRLFSKMEHLAGLNGTSFWNSAEILDATLRGRMATTIIQHVSLITAMYYVINTPVWYWVVAANTGHNFRYRVGEEQRKWLIKQGWVSHWLPPNFIYLENINRKMRLISRGSSDYLYTPH